MAPVLFFPEQRGSPVSAEDWATRQTAPMSFHIRATSGKTDRRGDFENRIRGDSRCLDRVELQRA